MNLDPATAAIRQRLAEILPSADFYLYAAPILIMLVGALVALLVGVFRANPDKPNFPAYGIAIVSSLTAGLLPLALGAPPTPRAYLGSGFLVDGLTQFSLSLIALGTLFTVLTAGMTSLGRQLLRPELTTLLMFSSAGMMIMCAAGEFMSFFTGLEITSLSLYILVGYQRQEIRGLEAALKYFLLGSTAAAIILMGMALIYLHTGSMRWVDLSALSLADESPFGLLGMMLLVCGLAFKLAIAPFHSWAPDVYQGANATLSGYMATLVKASIAMVFIRILGAGLREPSPALVQLFWILGAFSIIVGSLFGLVHNSIKRMLAYSSIANAGYFCLAFAALALNPGSQAAKEALVAYTAVYTVLNLGAFAVLAWLEEGNREDLLKEELAGLGARHPFPAFAMSVFLFGLAGIPPVAGFFGKFLLINAAVSEGLIGLSVVLVVFSCISLFYYLSLMVEMWLKPQTRASIAVHDGAEMKTMRMLVGIAVVASLVIGIVGPRWAVMVDYRMAFEPTGSPSRVVDKLPLPQKDVPAPTPSGAEPPRSQTATLHP